MEIRGFLGNALAKAPFPEFGGVCADDGSVRCPFGFGGVEGLGEVGRRLGKRVMRHWDCDEGWMAVEAGMGRIFVEEDGLVSGRVQLDQAFHEILNSLVNRRIRGSIP